MALIGLAHKSPKGPKFQAKAQSSIFKAQAYNWDLFGNWRFGLDEGFLSPSSRGFWFRPNSEASSQ